MKNYKILRLKISLLSWNLIPVEVIENQRYYWKGLFRSVWTIRFLCITISFLKPFPIISNGLHTSKKDASNWID